MKGISGFIHELIAYPIASLSSLAFYALLITLLIPATRQRMMPWLMHPIPPHQQYLKAFDSFRGLAAALVAIWHIWYFSYPLFAASQLAMHWIAYAHKAVPMFAVLSGFLIYRSVLSIRSISDLREYGIRRLFRIYPVYLLGVVLCLGFGLYSATKDYSRTNYFFSDLLMFNVISWPGGFANPVAWSLYIEVAFYAFLPLVVIVIGRKNMIAFALLGIIGMILADYPSRVFALWRFFLVGILASELSPRLRPAAAFPLLIAGLGLLYVEFLGPDYDWPAKLGIGQVHMDGETIGLGLACGLILASLPNLEIISQALNILPLRLLGLISYSVYIIHPFYILANFPEIGAFSTSPALLEHFKSLPGLPPWYLPLCFLPGVFTWGLISFLLVERPGMQFGKWLTKQLPPTI